jgi:phosphotransferase system, enzyme I, PtsP
VDIVARVIGVIEAETSAASALRAAAVAIAAELRSQSCAVFLAAPKSRLVLWELAGEKLDSRSQSRAQSLGDEALAHVLPAIGGGATRALCVAPLWSRARPIGSLVVERPGSDPYTAQEVATLATVASHVVGIIEGVRLLEIIEEIPSPSLRERASSAPPPRALEPPGECVLRGVAASPGLAVGRAVLRDAHPRPRVQPRPSAGPMETERARDAIQKTRNDLISLQSAMAREIDEEDALVFGSHLMFLADPMLNERIEVGLTAGLPAELAIDAAFEEIVRRLKVVDVAYIRDKIEDVEDLHNRIQGHLLGDDPPEPLAAQLVVSRRVTPSLVVELRLAGGLGIASELGGTTSHGVLLARALGIPAVTGVAGLTEQVVPGESLVIDAEEGLVILRPSAATLARYQERQQALERRESEFLRYRDRPAESADGVTFELRANIALSVDLEAARENGAHGVGLYRTEFPFIVRDGIPTLEKQVRIYANAYQAFPDGPIAFRILDLAADKLVPGIGPQSAASAFHGYRSIRVLFDYPHVLRDQVQAFAIAAAGRPLSILVPMVTSLDELRRVKQLAASALAQHPVTRHAPAPSYGAMIEVPGAVELVPDLAREVDFFSIGTNDLIQYSLVVDREDPRISTMHDAFHPAILRMIRRVIVAAHAAGKHVSVCGEMASHPQLGIAMLALGVDALSMTPRAIPAFKRALAGVRMEPLKARIGSMLELSTASEIQRVLGRHLVSVP